MKAFFVFCAFALMLVGTSATTNAQPPAPNPNALITPELHKLIDGWIDSKIVRLSVNAQNDRYASVTQSEIDRLDKQWRAELEKDDKPLIAATLSNPLSVYLSRMQGRSVGLFVEIFVMDRHGLNVGQSSITGDFWQGDESKFKKTFPKGAGTIFVDEPEWDDEFMIWRAQINRTVTDESGNTPIGAVTIEVNLTELARRHGAGS